MGVYSSTPDHGLCFPVLELGSRPVSSRRRKARFQGVFDHHLGGCLVGRRGPDGRSGQGGYLEAVQKLVSETHLQPGESVVDVGCAPGSLDRWLAHYTGGANPIVGVDISTHLLREAIRIQDGVDFGW